MMPLARHLLTKFLTEVGRFGDHNRNQRRLSRRCPISSGIGAPLHRNTHMGAVYRAKDTKLRRDVAVLKLQVLNPRWNFPY